MKSRSLLQYIFCLITLCVIVFALNACTPAQQPPPEEQWGEEKNKGGFLEHKIKFPGETLGIIAAWYTGSATNYQKIEKANPGVKSTALHIGQTIKIPDQLVKQRKVLTKDFVSKARQAVVPKQAPAPKATEDKEPAENEKSVEKVTDTGPSTTEAPLQEPLEPSDVVPSSPPTTVESVSSIPPPVAPPAVETPESPTTPITSSPAPVKPVTSENLPTSDAEREKILEELLKD